MMKILDCVNRLLFSYREQHSDEKLGNILVVSNTGFGDTIMSTPAIKTLKKSFCQNRVIFLANKRFSSLFVDYKFVDDIWEYTGGYINLFSIIFRCRIEKIHTIFLFHSNSPEDVFISLLSGAKNILRWTDNNNHDFKALFLNSVNTKEQHHIEKKIDLVRYFKPKFVDTTMSIADHYYQQKQIEYISTEQKIIGVQLGAQDTYKIWPLANVISLSKRLIERNFFLVFFGATKFESQMMKVIESVIEPSGFLNLCRKTSISELPAFIKGLDLLVTNDTGILHLAIAMKVKSLSLFGPTSSKEFGAYQDKDLHHSIQKDGFFVNNKPKKQRTQEGMKLISVDDVLSKIEEII